MVPKVPTSEMPWGEPFTGPVDAVELIKKGFELAPHCHHEAQLMLVVRGLVTCEVASGLWMVPPQCALWIPACMTHSMRGVGDLQLYCVYVDPKLAESLPRECCVLTVSPLLREIVIEISHSPNRSRVDGPDARLIGFMIDQLATASVERLHLPMPLDRRLRQMASRLMADPSDRTTIPEWARIVGMSERTLCRQLSKETGMSFGRWRQQFQIMLALDRLSEGDSIQTVAFALGYESSSAFVTMFRKTLGKPPLRFLADRTQGIARSRLNGDRIKREPARLS
jgi:AraC-like DNA-binding protein